MFRSIYKQEKLTTISIAIESRNAGLGPGSRGTSNNKRRRRAERAEKLYERFMSAIIRSRVTQYRLIIEDEVQAGRQALTYALNSRGTTAWVASLFSSFFQFFSLRLSRSRFEACLSAGVPRTLILATLMRLCYFSPYP